MFQDDNDGISVYTIPQQICTSISGRNPECRVGLPEAGDELAGAPLIQPCVHGGVAVGVVQIHTLVLVMFPEDDPVHLSADGDPYHLGHQIGAEGLQALPKYN